MTGEANITEAEKVDQRQVKQPMHPALIKIIDMLAKQAAEDYFDEIKKSDVIR